MADIPSVPVISSTSSLPSSAPAAVPSLGGLGSSSTLGAPSSSLLKGGISEAAAEAVSVDPVVKAKNGHPGSSYAGKVSSGNSGLVADAIGRYGEYKSADIRSSRPLPHQNETKNSADVSQPGAGKMADNDRGAGRAFNEAIAKIQKEEAEKKAALSKKDTADLVALKADLERRIDAGDNSEQTRLAKAKIDKQLQLPAGHVGRH